VAYQVGDKVRLAVILEDEDGPKAGATGTVIYVEEGDLLDLCIDWDNYEGGHSGAPWTNDNPKANSRWWVSSETVDL